MDRQIDCETCILLPKCLLKVKEYSGISANNFRRQYGFSTSVSRDREFVSSGISRLVGECYLINNYIYTSDNYYDQPGYFNLLVKFFDQRINWS